MLTAGMGFICENMDKEIVEWFYEIKLQIMN
jgi:hypothetical protein